MPTLARPFLTAGAAAAVAILGTATQAVVPSGPAALPAVTQAYDLTAASDISGQAVGVVFLAGWGDFIGPDDPYYPGQFNNDLRLSGPLGVAYYMIDTSMNAAVTKNLENYIFELAALESDPVQAALAAARAAAYVAVASNLGVGSVPAKLAKSLIYGVPFDLPGAIVQLTAPIPLAGDIISVYFTGRAEGDPAVYGTGINGLVAYSGTLLPWLKPLLGPAGRPQQAAAAVDVLAAEATGEATSEAPEVALDATVDPAATENAGAAEAYEQVSPAAPAEVDVPAVASGEGVPAPRPAATTTGAAVTPDPAEEPETPEIETPETPGPAADPADLAAATVDPDVAAASVDPDVAAEPVGPDVAAATGAEESGPARGQGSVDAESHTPERRADVPVRRGDPRT